MIELPWTLWLDEMEIQMDLNEVREVPKTDELEWEVYGPRDRQRRAKYEAYLYKGRDPVIRAEVWANSRLLLNFRMWRAQRRLAR